MGFETGFVFGVGDSDSSSDGREIPALLPEQAMDMKSFLRLALVVVISASSAVLATLWTAAPQQPVTPEAVTDISKFFDAAQESLINGDSKGIALFEQQVPADHPERSAALLALGEQATRFERKIGRAHV